MFERLASAFRRNQYPGPSAAEAAAHFVREILAAGQAEWPKLVARLKERGIDLTGSETDGPEELTLLMIMGHMEVAKAHLSVAQGSLVYRCIVKDLRAARYPVDVVEVYRQAWLSAKLNGVDPLEHVGKAFLERLGYTGKTPDAGLGDAIAEAMAVKIEWWTSPQARRVRPREGQ